MEHYLAARQNHLLKLGCMDEEALFVNRQGRRLTAASVSGGIRRLADRAGIEKVTLHMFRHSCASELIEEGLSLPEVQAVLGHQSIGTTMRYLSISDPRRHQAVSHHPLNDILAVEGVAS
jgi:site-specific recombinase XerD